MSLSLSPENLPYSWLLCPSQVNCGMSTQAETLKSPYPLPQNEGQIKKGRGRAEWGHTWCLVILVGRSHPGREVWDQPDLMVSIPLREEVGAADTPCEEFCWKTKCKEAGVHDCYHVHEELFRCFRIFFFFTLAFGGVFCLSVWELLSSSLACGILVPQPGMESSPLLWQHEDFNHWTAG